MDELLEQLAVDPWGRLVLHYVATCGMWNCYLFLLVAARLTGVLVVAPCVITTTIPLLVRIVLTVLLTLVIVPTLSTQRATGNALMHVSHEVSTTTALPATAADLATVIATEIGFGGLLGTGLIAVFGGLRLGGEWLDRHSGLGMGTSLNPEWRVGETACGSLSLWLGIVAFLLIEPAGGHLMILQSLLRSFQAIPVGSVLSSSYGMQMFNGLIQESLVLGLRISMPLIATMMLVDVTLAFAARDASASLSSPCQLLRLGIAFFVLAITMTTVPDAIATTLESATQWIGASLPLRG